MIQLYVSQGREKGKMPRDQAGVEAGGKGTLSLRWQRGNDYLPQLGD